MVSTQRIKFSTSDIHPITSLLGLPKRPYQGSVCHLHLWAFYCVGKTPLITNHVPLWFFQGTQVEVIPPNFPFTPSMRRDIRIPNLELLLPQRECWLARLSKVSTQLPTSCFIPNISSVLYPWESSPSVSYFSRCSSTFVRVLLILTSISTRPPTFNCLDIFLILLNFPLLPWSTKILYQFSNNNDV